MKLSDRQIDVMGVLWTRGEATTAEVHEALQSKGLAYTTVATLLKRLEEKAVIDHRNEGRQYVYRPLIPEREVRNGMVSNLVERLFRGDPAALVSHLLGNRDIDEDDLQRIEEMLQKRGQDDE